MDGFNVNHNPQSDAVAPVAGSEPEASGRTADGRLVAPVAAAKKMEAGALCVFRVHRTAFAVIALVEPVPAPFPNIAVHIVSTKIVRPVRKSTGWNINKLHADAVRYDVTLVGSGVPAYLLLQ